MRVRDLGTVERDRTVMHLARSGLPAGRWRERAPRGPEVCLAAILLSSIVSAGGCSSHQPAPAENAILRLGTQNVAEARGVLTELLFAEPLMVVDWHGRPAPLLASGWQWLDNGRTLNVQLRSDVKFHDGSPFTAERVATILRRRVKVDPRRLFEYVTAIETPDERTVLIRLSRADAFLLGALAATVIVDDDKPAIGTGPFRLLSRTPPIRAERNDAYYRGAPGIDQVQIVTYDTQRAAWAAMMRGDLDMVQEVNREVVEFLEGSSRFEMYSSIRPFYIPLVFNVRHPILRNVEVRRALAEAINRTEIVNEVMRGRGQIADDPVWPSHWAYNSTARKYSYNPHAARARLDAAGFRVRRPSDADGMASRFRLKCLFYNKDFQFERIALLLRRQLAEVDVELVLEGDDTTAIISRIARGEFDSYLFQLTSGRSFDWTYRLWHSAKPGAAYQDSGYAGADEVLDRLRHALQDSDVRAAVADLRARFHEDVPAAFLAWPETTRAVDARFDIGDRSNPDIFANLWRWRAGPRQEAAR
jgi:ABC-type transport system substrate-binding protein